MAIRVLLTVLLLTTIVVLFAACQHEHVYAAWTVEKQETCTENGIEVRVCECGEKERRDIPMKEHTPVTDEAIAATCTTDGKAEGSHCGVCETVLVAQNVVPATEHSVVTDEAVAPTCMTDGKTQGTHCGTCQAVIIPQVGIPATGHAPVNDDAIAPTCTTDGKTQGAHCGTCQAVIIPQVNIPALGHIAVKDLAVAVTCTTDGKTEGSHCAVCLEVLVAQNVIPATGHTSLKDAAVAATCTTDGKTEGSHCGVCQTILVAQNVIPATGHTSVKDAAVAPTCTANGKTEGSHCGTCATVLVAQNILPATGHSTVKDAAVAPTCTKDGKTQGTHCKTCQEIIIPQVKIPALGHASVTDAAVAVTCTTDGKTEGSHCAVCSEVLVAQNVIHATGHKIVTTAAVVATCTTDGKTKGSHCSVCAEVVVAQDVIPATGHKYNDGKILEEATCTTQGTRTFTCTVSACGHSYTESYSLPAYTATEIYNQSIEFVGEIITYDREGKEFAQGSGFVISSDGKIVTNYHVLEDAYSAKITINGTTYDIAYVLAYDAHIDLAVLKINASGLPVARICKQPVNVGETVYALGSPRGMTNTYSQGIVTYANRVVDDVSHIQHDASIAAGNSGGPLINVYGEVIGINTWTVINSQNLNFAVSVTELDNLVYGTPLSMAEFYQKEFDVFFKLKNYITENGSYNADTGMYMLILGESYSSDRSLKYTRAAFYDVSDNIVILALIVNDGELWLFIEIDEGYDGIYNWMYFDDYGYEMSGAVTAATFTSNTLLGYSYTNIRSSSMKATVRELASSMMSLLCMFINEDGAPIGVTAEDLYFYNY